MPKLQCLTEAQLIKKIEEAAKGSSLSSWAVENGVQPSAPSAFVRRVQPAGKQIPAAFGLVPITVFVDKDDPNYFEYPRRGAPAKAPVPLPESKKDKKKKKKDKKKGKKNRG